jgi:hypothetical protein
MKSSQDRAIRLGVAKLVRKTAGAFECNSTNLVRIADALVQAAAELYEAAAPGRGSGELHAVALRLAEVSAFDRSKRPRGSDEPLPYQAARGFLWEAVKCQRARSTCRRRQRVETNSRPSP